MLAVRAGEGSIAAVDVAGLWVYTPDVPTEPAALAGWLAHATNATAVAGSDAITWPH